MPRLLSEAQCQIDQGFLTGAIQRVGFLLQKSDNMELGCLKEHIPGFKGPGNPSVLPLKRYST